MHKLSWRVGLILTVFVATPAHSYIGPGAGAGAIAVVLGVLGSILLAFVAILWYPIKRLFKGKKSSAKTTDDTTKNEGTEETLAKQNAEAPSDDECAGS